MSTRSDATVLEIDEIDSQYADKVYAQYAAKLEAIDAVEIDSVEPVEDIDLEEPIGLASVKPTTSDK